MEDAYQCGKKRQAPANATAGGPRHAEIMIASPERAKPREAVARPHVRKDAAMQQFIEMTGKTLMRVIKEDEISPEQLRASGVTEESLIRVNPQGDIEVRRKDSWDVIGGLLGEFIGRVRHDTGLDWA